MTTQEKIAKLKARATANYNKGGWDVFAECWSDSDYEELLAENGNNFNKAISAMKNVAECWADQQADAENSAF